MTVKNKCYYRLFHTAPFWLYLACGDDLAQESETEPSIPGSSTITDSSIPTTTRGSTSSSDTSGTTDPGLDECGQAYPLPTREFALADETPAPAQVSLIRDCSGLGVLSDDPKDLRKLFPIVDDFEIYVYHPTIPNEEGWPMVKLPSVIFSPGAGQYTTDMNDAPLYLPLIKALTQSGFVVFAIQPPENFRGATWTVAQRAAAIGCTAAWTYRSWLEKDNNRLNCDIVVAGHSRGGEAAYLAAASIHSSLLDLGRLILRGVFALAPRSNQASLDEIPTGPVSGEMVVPYLGLHGGNDEDVRSGPTRAFEIYGSEDSTPLPTHDKFLLWVYDAPHNVWGGTTVPSDLADEREKAELIEEIYIPAFLRWQFLAPGDSADKDLFINLVRNGSSASDFPTELDELDFWDDSSPEYQDLDERPLIFGNFTPGLKGDPAARIIVDTMKRPGFDQACNPLSLSTLGENVSFSGLSNTQVCLGRTIELIQMPKMNEDEHQSTSAMRVRWGGTEAGGSVRWVVNRDLTKYSHVSFRLGQIFGKSPDSSSTIRFGLETAPSGQVFAVDVPIIPQSNEEVNEATTMTGHVVDFMRTVRMPLSQFCDLGADVSQIDAIVIDFPGGGNDSRSVLLDSIEFSRPTEDDEAGRCP